MPGYTITAVSKIPFCDFPHARTAFAAYEGATAGGPWAYMCVAHFRVHGIGIGLGKGQRLVLAETASPVSQGR
jgi:hypothetical protein